MVKMPGYRLLLVDDKDMIRRTVKRLLMPHFNDMTIDEACNGQEACDYVKQTPPDMVLMDIQMPVMDGAEAVKKMREMGYQNPVVLWTNMDEKAIQLYRKHCRAATDVLSKDDYAFNPQGIIRRHLEAAGP